MGNDHKYDAIVVGTSAGGLYALTSLLQDLSPNFPVPVIIVQHRSKDMRDLLEEILQIKLKIRVKQADEKEKITAGYVFIAPPDYHLLIENDYTFSLSSDPPVRFSRPSIDVLFESAAIVYGDKMAAIILTGANSDGAAGIVAVKKNGGLTIVQNPESANFPFMPAASIKTQAVDKVWNLVEIKEFLNGLDKASSKNV